MTTTPATPDTPDTIDAHKCDDCATIWTSDELAPLYTCSRCGDTSLERRCDDCHIFMARDGEGCPECGVTCDEIDAVHDHDGTLIAAEDYDPDATKADRDAADAITRERERVEQAARDREALAAASDSVTADKLVVGDWIADPFPPREGMDARALVQAIYDWGETLGIVGTEYGDARLFEVPRNAPLTRVPAPEFGRDLNDDFGKVLLDLNGGPIPMSSPPQKDQSQFRVTASRATRSFSPAGATPMLSLVCAMGSTLAILGVFVDRAATEEALLVWERAARAMADAQGVPADAASAKVEMITTDWDTHGDRLGKTVHLTLGTNEWGRDTELPMLDAKVQNSMRFTLPYPDQLLAAVAAVRANLGHLRG